MAEQTRPRRGYAVGVQMFDWIRERGSVYVDKTEYVWKMVSTDAINFFLSRRAHGHRPEAAGCHLHHRAEIR